MDKPAFLIIAGPNGSGKSSAYTETDFDIEKQSIWIINPDLLTSQIQTAENLDLNEANLLAVTRLEKWLDATLDVHRTVGVETVLSTEKYRRLVTKSKLLGFQFWLIYIVLASPDLNIERVKIRVRKGGHHVPRDKIISRYYRSLEQLPWFLLEADRA